MTIIISLCLLLLIAYLFDLLHNKKILCNFAASFRLVVREATLLFEMPDLTDTLPILGTIGLILIGRRVAELELNV
jgi:hypothetical protein